MPKIPGVSHLDAVRALEKAGFRILRQRKHIVMSDGIRILTIPKHNPVRQEFVSPVQVFVEMRLLNVQAIEEWRAGRLPFLELFSAI